MGITPQTLAEATFTILPDPVSGKTVFLMDGVVIQTFDHLADAFTFGSEYVKAPFLPKTTSDLITIANHRIK